MMGAAPRRHFALAREQAAVRRTGAEMLPHAVEDGFGDGR